MKSYKEPYEYKNEILKKYKSYNPIIHTSKEKKYNYFDKNHCAIELPNKENDSLFIFLEDEITVVFGDWHCHYYYEDREDYEEVIERVDSILKNEECHIVIYSNGVCFGTGATSHKGKYTEEEIINFLISFFGESFMEFNKTFKRYGTNIKLRFWDSSKDYELKLDKNIFRKE